jgi:hypothetical protein
MLFKGGKRFGKGEITKEIVGAAARERFHLIDCTYFETLPSSEIDLARHRVRPHLRHAYRGGGRAERTVVIMSARQRENYPEFWLREEFKRSRGTAPVSARRYQSKSNLRAMTRENL